MFVYVIISLLSIEKTLPQNGSFFDTKVSGRKDLNLQPLGHIK